MGFEEADRAYRMMTRVSWALGAVQLMLALGLLAYVFSPDVTGSAASVRMVSIGRAQNPAIEREPDRGLGPRQKLEVLAV